jgi:hypothetical protein
MKINWIAIALAIILIGILVWIIVCQVREHNLQDDPMLHRLKDVVGTVHPVAHRLKLYKSDKNSYTLNKEKIFLRVKDEDGNYYPLNMLVYVLLHEIAHLLNTVDVGHTEEFHRVFDELLDKATSVGAFNPSIPIIKEYAQE